MLAVVEHQKRFVVFQMCAKRLDQRLSCFFVQTERLGGSIRHQRSILDRRQVDEPHAIGIVFQHIRGDLQRETRLAEAAHAEERQQTGALQHRFAFGELALPSHKGGDLLRQIVRRRFQRA